MLPEPIRALIVDEQARHANRLIEGVDLEAYLAKLGEKAELLSDSVAGRCRGVVAFYCNDESTKQAFLTLVLVASADRGAGLGRALVGCVLDIARHRGFLSCRLEVAQGNDVGRRMYKSLGFRIVQEKGERHVMEVAL
jgi:ribosomal protein S18 acetylase RimI-like enzyme